MREKIGMTPIQGIRIRRKIKEFEGRVDKYTASGKMGLAERNLGRVDGIRITLDILGEEL
jgi:hypothetical protein